MTAAADLKLMMYMYTSLAWVPMENIGIKQTVMIWRSGMCDLYLAAQSIFW